MINFLKKYGIFLAIIIALLIIFGNSICSHIQSTKLSKLADAEQKAKDSVRVYLFAANQFHDKEMAMLHYTDSLNGAIEKLEKMLTKTEINNEILANKVSQLSYVNSVLYANNHIFKGDSVFIDTNNYITLDSAQIHDIDSISIALTNCQMIDIAKDSIINTFEREVTALDTALADCGSANNSLMGAINNSSNALQSCDKQVKILQHQLTFKGVMNWIYKGVIVTGAIVAILIAKGFIK